MPECWVKWRRTVADSAALAELGECYGEIYLTEIMPETVVYYCENPKHDPDRDSRAPAG